MLQVVALGLLGAATTIVDIMMLYILPQKDKYENAKNEDVKHISEDFDDETVQTVHSKQSVTDSGDSGDLKSSLLGQPAQ